LALQELSRPESENGEDDRRNRVALEIGVVGGARHSMSGEHIRRQEARDTNAPDQRHGGSRSTSRSGTKIAHESDQVTRGERETGWSAFDNQEQQEASSSPRVLQRPFVRVPSASTAIWPKIPTPTRHQHIGIWMCCFFGMRQSRNSDNGYI
jgi:hypothetical protein